MSSRLNRTNTIALMIDMQEKLMPPMANREGVTNRTLFLLKALRELQIPIFASQQYTRGLGMTEESFLTSGNISEDDIFEKITYSCLQDEKIHTAVRNMERKNMLIFGVEAHICVQQTVLDLLEEGYDVYVIADCTDSRFETDRSIALRRMEKAGAIITTSESIVYELLERAGTSEFKVISGYVKEAKPFAKNS